MRRRSADNSGRATHLVDVARRAVEDAQHGHDPVRVAVRARDVGAPGADVVDGEADPAGALADERAPPQRPARPARGVSKSSSR